MERQAFKDQLISEETALGLLGNISRVTLWRLRRRGKIQAVKIGGNKYRLSDIQHLIQSGVPA